MFDMVMEKTIDKRICMGIYFRTGLGYESDDMTGISHLVEHMLFRRLNKISNEELYSILNKTGATLSGCTYPDGIQFKFVFNREYIDTILELVNNLFCTHCWTRKEVELEKKIILRQIRESGYGDEDKLDELYYEGCYYAKKVAGNKSSVKSITVEAVNKFAKEFITVSNAGVVLTGAYDESVVKLINEAMITISNSKENDIKPELIPYQFPCRFEKRNENDIVCKRWQYDSRIIVSFDVSKRNELEKLLLLDMVFLGDGSVIGNSLREAAGLTGNILTEVSRNRGFTKYTAYFDVQNGDEEEAIALLIDEIARFLKSDKSKHLEENIRFYIDGSDICSSISEHNTWIGYGKYLINDNHYFAEDTSELYGQMNAETLDDRAKELFVKSNMSLSVLKGSGSTVTKKTILKYWNML
ncbi:MAG: insulinase family protein [Eubacteriaceae bacterium]|nr:insulinase family protein [Eubacteriaceae bacterium]